MVVDCGKGLLSQIGLIFFQPDDYLNLILSKVLPTFYLLEFNKERLHTEARVMTDQY